MTNMLTFATATPQGHGLGWKKDRPDSRDHEFASLGVASPVLPTSHDLTSSIYVPIFDQGPVGSCTSNMASYLDVYARVKEHLYDTYVKAGGASRLGIYYYTRLGEGTPNVDAGASIRDAIKTMNSYGACSEANWPYNLNNIFVQPSAWSTANMSHHKALRYYAVGQDAAQIMGTIASGFPIGYGTVVFPSFEATDASGIVADPDPSREAPIGGHALSAVGYRSINNRLYAKVRNSWGDGWGDKGYCYISFDYLLNAQLCFDFWVVKAVA